MRARTKTTFQAFRASAVAVSSMLVLGACAGKRDPLDTFAERQSSRVVERSAYIQADFDFWAAAYEPTREDLEALRAAWVENREAFPESKPIATIEKELRDKNHRVVLMAVFMTEYDKADLNDKSMGWAVSPVPVKIIELSETDLVLRRFMPVRNQWARYFLLRYVPG